MPLPSAMSDLTATAWLNYPPGSNTPSVLDDAIRALSAIVKQNVSKGADIASASTLPIPASGGSFIVTGSVGIGALSSTYSWDGREVVLKFAAALTITHNATSLILPGGANFTTAAGDTLRFIQESAGNWRCNGSALNSGGSVGGVPASGGTMTGHLNEARATVVGDATATPIWSAAGNAVAITGTPTITDFPDAPQAGAVRRIFPAAGTILTNNANIAVQGAANYTFTTGDWAFVEALTVDSFKATIVKANGHAVVEPVGARPREVFTANGSWTAPEGVTTVYISGAGGGGGGNGAASRAGGGGGGGQSVYKQAVTVVPGTSYPVTIGAGGAAGSNGGATSLGALLTLSGGTAGGLDSGANTAAVGGASGGGLSENGKSGAIFSSIGWFGGGGGGTVFGGGGAGGFNNAGSSAGVANTGGGGGGSGNQNGASGGSGILIVEYQ